ncbi:MAG: (2Fe-2S)-binding protein, partial [Geminicoccaceae bacterium]|nr:(2Fe-2S)-binding protein [Geminicoccaceae bacterium]
MPKLTIDGQEVEVEPGSTVLQAIEAAGREGEGIVITGIDANPQAREAIA